MLLGLRCSVLLFSVNGVGCLLDWLVPCAVTGWFGRMRMSPSLLREVISSTQTGRAENASSE